MIKLSITIFLAVFIALSFQQVAVAAQLKFCVNVMDKNMNPIGGEVVAISLLDPYGNVLESNTITTTTNIRDNNGYLPDNPKGYGAKFSLDGSSVTYPLDRNVAGGGCNAFAWYEIVAPNEPPILQ